jgi:hypothetical protein
LLPANWSIALPFLWFVVKTPHGMKVEIGIRAGNLRGYHFAGIRVQYLPHHLDFDYMF